MLEKIFFGGEKSPSAPSKRFIVVSELDPRPMLDLRPNSVLAYESVPAHSSRVTR